MENKKYADYDLNSPDLEIFSKIDPRLKTPKKQGWREFLNKSYTRVALTLVLLFTLFSSTFFLSSQIARPSFTTSSAEVNYLPQSQIEIPQPKKFTTCSEVISETEEINFLHSYCKGNFCDNQTEKEACESVDILVVEEGFLTEDTGQDGISDCVWNEDEKCLPKY